ncbi:TIGR04222 domain-containing membrane protein [Actinokineospora iranica]|uniref:TIGR04222 domain-containing protein n=1 Tax=Actinokineospora iranica TaxID=1271860 RepID=A0A1G6LL65_9PSEU|nr:TIGR04222 domain-containing membrane protein [Actinokineospora iranica]SDC43993.1 TIGR04222 domain-containing protein [Actinokineospora iranica]
MNEPWGISGPEFLRLYLVAAGFAVLIALAVRIMARTASATERTPGQLTLDELAYLAGGTRRVVETAVARLLDEGKLRISRTGAVGVVDGARGGGAVDQAVLADAKRYGHRTLRLLVDKVGQDAAVTRIGADLTRKGLLVDKGMSRARLSAAPLAVLFAVGAARWVNGLSEGRPIGWLTLALLGTAVVAAVLFRRPVPSRTYQGARMLAEARRGRATASSRTIGAHAPDYALGTAAGLVVFGGLATYPDAEIAAALETQRAATGYSASSSGTSSSSSCGGGSGSSCSSGGGGGGCGGGGGGCGG